MIRALAEVVMRLFPPGLLRLGPGPLRLGPLLLGTALVGCVPVLESPGGADTAGVAGSDWVAPTNGWSAGSPPAGLEGEGWSEGEVAPEFRLMDQHGDTVSLWQFYGDVVVLDLSTMWCGPCIYLAEAVDETWFEYRDQGFMYLTVLPQDNAGAVPDQEDLQKWASDHDISAPVLSADKELETALVPDGSFPRVYVIDREMVVHEDRVNPADDATIRSIVESLL